MPRVHPRKVQCATLPARALRSVADSLLSVACAMLQNRTVFDPALRNRDRAIMPLIQRTQPQPSCQRQLSALDQRTFTNGGELPLPGGGGGNWRSYGD